MLNALAVMQIENIGIEDVAFVLGLPAATVVRKLRQGDFTVEEAFCIKTRLFPDYDLEYLFADE